MGKETEQKQEIVNQGVHTYSQEESYVWPQEPILREQLEWFQDQKLALMVHWGVYNQLGMVASWALSDEDAEWSRKTVDWTDDGEVFKRQYRALNRAFDPVAFQPEEWAKMAKKCGFRYLILTTKHHDGFCLWDTAYTEYKTTAEDCPFHTHKYADIVRAMFDAFRKEGLGIGVYYSKADWHCPDYWEKEKVFTGKTTRNPTYDPKENPEAWERFRAFTRDQILELGKQYGRLDILWFDAGWVAATNGQDIRLGEIVEEVRKTQPWVLAVDRTVGGAYENYVTPEMCVPEKPLRVPWESCLTLGADFNYAYGDHYSSGQYCGEGRKFGIKYKPSARRKDPGGSLGEPAGTGRVDADIWGSHLWNENLCTVSERKSGIYAKRRYRLCDPAVSGGKGSSRRETFDSLSGENPRDFHGRYEERG